MDVTAASLRVARRRSRRDGRVDGDALWRARRAQALSPQRLMDADERVFSARPSVWDRPSPVTPGEDGSAFRGLAAAVPLAVLCWLLAVPLVAIAWRLMS